MNKKIRYLLEQAGGISAQYTLRDDGAGPYIETWSAGISKPIQAELDALDTASAYQAWILTKIKEDKLAEIRSQAEVLILTKWPLWLQSNIALGLDGEPLASQCRADIADVRDQSNAHEAVVLAMTDVQAVAAYQPVWRII